MLQGVEWFWEMVEGMRQEQRRQLLRFWTALHTLPAGQSSTLHAVIGQSSSCHPVINCLSTPEAVASQSSIRDAVAYWGLSLHAVAA